MSRHARGREVGALRTEHSEMSNCERCLLIHDQYPPLEITLSYFFLHNGEIITDRLRWALAFVNLRTSTGFFKA